MKPPPQRKQHPDIVIDVGCARYGGDYSIERLVDEFHPRVLYGFDPNSTVAEGTTVIDGTNVVVFRQAAWKHNGHVGYVEDGLKSWISDTTGSPVPCIDLAEFIHDLPDGDEVILKIDAEGAEYDLLPHLMIHAADLRLALAWVEWHQPDRGRKRIEDTIRCTIVEWTW